MASLFEQLRNSLQAFGARSPRASGATPLPPDLPFAPQSGPGPVPPGPHPPVSPPGNGTPPPTGGTQPTPPGGGNPPPTSPNAPDVQTTEGIDPTLRELMRTDSYTQILSERSATYLRPNYAPIPVNFDLHYRLCNYFLDHTNYSAALEEINLALHLNNRSDPALMRKCLVLVSLKQYADASAVVDQLTAEDPARQANPDIAGNIGRIHRELWEQSSEQDTQELQQAIDAYKAAMDGDASSYYAGVNWAELMVAMDKHHGSGPENLKLYAAAHFILVLPRCLAAQQHGDNSFWLYTTLGETALGLNGQDKDPRGAVEHAKAEYRQAATRPHSRREWLSAMGGLQRIITYLGYPADIMQTITSYDSLNAS